MKVLKNLPCEQCGTRRYRQTEEGGMVCKYGHLLLGWRQEEGDDYVWMGRRRPDNKATTVQEANVKAEFFKGVEREAARLRIVQYGLQLVVRALVHEMQFPAEFEYTARELWLTYVSASDIQLPHEFIEQYSNDDNTKQHASSSKGETLEEEFSFSNDEDTSDESSNSSSDKGKDEKKTKRKPFTTDWPNLRLEDIVVFCYLTCLWMKIPVLSNDIHRWCFSYQLPYMKIMEGLPDDFVKRLDSAMTSMFTTIPCHSKVVSRINSYKRAFTHHCNIQFPKANVPLLIHRFLTQFYLPEQLYFGAERLYKRLNTFYATRGYKRMPLDDVQAMVCTVILVKLSYRLDDKALNPVFEDNDMPSLSPKNVWYQLVQDNLLKWSRLQKHDSLQVDEAELPVVLEFLKDIGRLSTKQGGKVQSNALRQHMSRTMSMESDISQRSKDSVYMKPDPRTPDIINTESDMDTCAVGSKYVTYRRDHDADGVFHQEYIVVVMLASYILGMDFWKFHRCLSLCETHIHAAIKQA